MSDSTSSSTLGSLDWPRLMLIRPNWPPVMNAVNGLIDCTTSPDSGSLKVGMGGSFLVSVLRHAQRFTGWVIVLMVERPCQHEQPASMRSRPPPDQSKQY